MNVIIAICTLGKQANIDKLLNTHFWMDAQKHRAKVHILSQLERIRLAPETRSQIRSNSASVNTVSLSSSPASACKSLNCCADMLMLSPISHRI